MNNRINKFRTMTQKEFEERIGGKIDNEKFGAVHRLYMATGNDFDKDKFCDAFKRTNPAITNAAIKCIIELDSKCEAFARNLEKVNQKLTDYKESVDSVLLNFLYVEPENTNVYNMVELEKILFFKIKNAIALSDYDIEELRNILKVKKQEEK